MRSGILTFPGMKSSPILAPFAGTSLEFSEVVVGAIRKDSLITAVFKILSSKHHRIFLLRAGILLLPSRAVSPTGLL